MRHRESNKICHFSLGAVGLVLIYMYYVKRISRWFSWKPFQNAFSPRIVDEAQTGPQAPEVAGEPLPLQELAEHELEEHWYWTDILEEENVRCNDGGKILPLAVLVPRLQVHLRAELNETGPQAEEGCVDWSHVRALALHVFPGIEEQDVDGWEVARVE